MIHIAICDDEKIILDHIKQFVSNYFCRKNIEKRISLFSSGAELLQSGEEPDILFLDIQMGQMDGMETARKMRSQGYRGEIIFITILKEMVFDSFEVRAFDYLLKPLQEKEFEHTMERLLSTLKRAEEGKLLIQRGNEDYIVSFDEIRYCEVIDRKIYLYLDSGEIMDYYDRMNHLTKKLDARFYRCHRSYLINLRYLESYQNGFAHMAGGGKIPVSRSHSREFSQVVLAYMKEWRI